MKKLATAVTALGVGLALAIAGVVPANAAGIDASGPITVLPSAVAAGSGYTDAGKLGNSNAQAMAFLYKYATSPEVADALRAKQAGTALTPAQTQTIATRPNTSVTYPVGAAKPLTKTLNGVSGASSVLSNFQFGAQIGGIASQPLLSMFGIDARDTVCNARLNAGDLGSKALGFFSGQDCLNWETPDGFTPNVGVIPGQATEQVCIPDGGSCLKIEGAVQTLGPALLCMTKSGPWSVSGGYYRPQTGSGANISGADFTIIFKPGAVNTDRSASTPRMASSVAADYRDPEVKKSITTACGATDALVGEWVAEYLPFSKWEGVAFTNSRGDLLTGLGKPVETPANPQRQLQCVIASTTGQTFDKLSVPFDEASGVLPDVVCPELPEGLQADTVTVNEVGGGETHKLWDQKIPAEVTDAGKKYAECADSTCLVELVKLGSNPLTTCHQDPTGCADWYSDPNKTSKYSCTYGAHVVSLEECTTYADRWKPENVAKGQYLSDPKTGTPSPAPAGATQGTDKGAMSSPVQDPSKPRECFPTGWGIANPLNWVLQPAKCALEWAFVPRAAEQARLFDRMKAVTDRSGFGSLARLVSGFETLSVPAAGSCQGPPLTFNAFGISETSYPFSSCREPMSGVAATVKTLGAGVILLVSTMACTRYLAGIIGFTAFGIASAGSSDPDDATVNLRTGEVK